MQFSKLLALGAIVLWASLAMLGVRLAHLPPFWLTGVALLMVGLSVLVAWALPQGFIPTDDTGQIFAFTEAAQDVSFAEMVRHQQAAAAIVAKNPYVDTFMSASSAQADVVLPAAAYGEKEGTTTNLEGRVTNVVQKITPRGTSRART